MHPTRFDYEAYKEWRDIEDERQRQALRNFYRRNAAPHYSKPFRQWRIARPLILAWDVYVFLVAMALELYGCAEQATADWWRRLPLYKRCGYIGCAVMTVGLGTCLAIAHLIDWIWP